MIRKRKKSRVSAYSSDEIYKMNITSRHAGVVGKNAIVPRIVLDIAKPDDLILDFGSGKTGLQSQLLRDNGYNVVAYEIGDNFNPNIHNSNALHFKYNIVYASNVLNVQPTPAHVVSVVELLRSRLKQNGILVVNYPPSPRYSHFSTRDLELYLSNVFSSVYKNTQFSSPVYICSK